MMSHGSRLTCVVLFCSALFSVSAQELRAQVITIKTIALSGDAGLKIIDPVIGVGGDVAIDSTGTVMFLVTTERGGDSTTRTVHVATSNGTTTSVLPGFDFLESQKPKPILGSSGVIAFPWFEGIEVGSRNGVFIGADLGNLGFIPADSLALPGRTEQNVFLVAGRPALNRTGEVVFATGFTAAGNQPLEPTNGIFFGTGPGGMFRIILAGEQAPDTAAGTVFNRVSLPLINDRGDVAFFGRLQLAASELATEGTTGIWLSSSQTGKVQVVVRAGATLLPGMAAETNFIGVSEDAFSLGPSGEVVFEATLAPPRLVPMKRMWRWSASDPLAPVLEPLFGVTKSSSLIFPPKTASDPGTAVDVVTAVDTDVVITSSGDLVYQSESRTESFDVESAIWKETGNSLEVIMHTGVADLGDGRTIPGSAAPGTGGTFTGFPVFTANGAGRVAFVAQYEVGGVIQGRGLWAQDSLGVLQLVALEGQELMARDRLKTVTGVALLTGPGNVSGFSGSYNDRFELAFIAFFGADSSSGIFRATIGDVPPPPPSAGKEYFWNRGCGDDNVHTICATDRTNWLDENDQPHRSPPETGADCNVTIAMNSPAGVTLDQRDIEIRKISAIGKLFVRKSLTLNEDSTMESLIMDSLESQIVANAKLTLTGADTVFQAGTLTINSEEGIVNEGTVTVEPFALNPVIVLKAPESDTNVAAKSNRLQSQTQATPTAIFAGDGPWANIPPANLPPQPGFGTFLQQFDILVRDHAGKRAIINANGATWTIETGSLLVDPQGALPKLTNEAVLLKKTTDSTDESFIDLEYEQSVEGSVVVEGGILTFRGGATFEGTGTFHLKSNASTLRFQAPQDGNRRLYQVLSGTVKVKTDPEITTPVFAVDNGATLSILKDAEFRTMLPASSDHARGGFELNDKGEILVEGLFRNERDFTWRGGTITTSGTAPFINEGNLSIEGKTLKTLAGRLENIPFGPRGRAVVNLRGTLTLAKAASVLNETFGTFLTLDDGEIATAADSGAVFENEGSMSVRLSDDATVDMSATIAAEFNNTGWVYVSQAVRTQNGASVPPSSTQTLSLTGGVRQMKDATLTGGSWVINPKGVLDLGSGAIKQLGKKTGTPARVVLLGDAVLRNFLLERIKKTGDLSVLGGPLILPGPLNNSGQLRVRLNNAGLRVNGDFDQRGFLTLGGKFEGSGETPQIQVHNGDVTFHPRSKTTINGNFKVFTTGKDITVFGTLNGSGNINGIDLQVIVDKGRIRVGNSPGTLTIDADYTQSAEGTLEIEIGGADIGTNQDQLVINGNADIGGTLVLKFIDDFSPTAGQTFDFLSVSGTQTGDFESVKIVDLAPGFEFEVTPTDTGFAMTAMSDGVFTGIPGEVNDVNVGFNTPEAETAAAQGDVNVPMLQFEVVPEGDGLNVTSLTLKASGSGDDAVDLSSVIVWADEDRNGRVDPPLPDVDPALDGVSDGLIAQDDRQIGTGVYDADNGTLNLTIDPPLALGPRETATLLVTYNIAGGQADTVATAQAHAVNGTEPSTESRLAVGVGSMVFPVLVMCALALGLVPTLRLVTTRKYRATALVFACILAGAGVVGCPDPDMLGPVPTPVTFQVTLTAISANESGTGIDASVNKLSLAGTNLTVLR